MRIVVPVGTRPEIIKLAPVVEALRASGQEVFVVATGQHHDAEMAGGVFSATGLEPDVRWSLPSGAAQRLARLVELATETLATLGPDLVLALGDTESVPTFLLGAHRARVPFAHLEAGLRSFNTTSVEEWNRRLAAAGARLNLAPTPLAARFLAAEGVEAARIRVVGNPALDALARAGLERVPPRAREGALVTAHRATNVDDPGRLERLVGIVAALPAAVGGPVDFPVHPRTAERLAADEALRGRLAEAGVRTGPPLPYPALLERLRRARIAVTDSGGLQEEAAWFGVPVVVLRTSTPRWEGVAAGTSALVGLDDVRAETAVRSLLTPDAEQRAFELPCPYGDGRTGERVAAVLAEEGIEELLRLDEPALGFLPSELGTT